jgi:hypothetical protein
MKNIIKTRIKNMLILSYFHENPFLFPAKKCLHYVRYYDYVECCQRQKKTSSHESIINLTQNVLYEIEFSRCWVNYRKLTFATVVDIRNVALFRVKITASSFHPKKPDCIFPVRCEGRVAYGYSMITFFF